MTVQQYLLKKYYFLYIGQFYHWGQQKVGYVCEVR